MELTQTPIVPNAIIANFNFVCEIAEGKLKNSIMVVYMTAHVEDYGTADEAWTPAPTKLVTRFIADIANLPAELAAMQAQAGQLFGGMLSVIDAIKVATNVDAEFGA